jgi:hypothetical protein
MFAGKRKRTPRIGGGNFLRASHARILNQVDGQNHEQLDGKSALILRYDPVSQQRRGFRAEQSFIYTYFHGYVYRGSWNGYGWLFSNQ